MPVLYGHNTLTGNDGRMDDISQFTRWFHLNEMDFELTNINRMWKCRAWERRVGKDEYGEPNSYWASGACTSVSDALIRCYEAIRRTQRAE